ncbi:Na+/H+ antiporter NhaC family protein [Dysosmobacter sp.]
MENKQTDIRKANGLALLPFVAFIVVFLGSGIILSFQGVFKPFSQFPPLAAAFIAIITAFLIHRGTGKEKLNLLLEGIARPNIALVVLIFALAGAFSGAAKGMGGVDSVVNLCLSIVPQRYIIMGVFVVGCVVSFASGSSLGTATMIAPIALGIVEATGIPLAPTMGAVFSGGMFGNQLSPISDCTIASTTGMGVSLKDKTKGNTV